MNPWGSYHLWWQYPSWLCRRVGGGVLGVRLNPLWNSIVVIEPPLKLMNSSLWSKRTPPVGYSKHFQQATFFFLFSSKGPIALWNAVTNAERVRAEYTYTNPLWKTSATRLQWGSLNLCFKIFDKFVLIIFFLSEDDPSRDRLEDNDELKPVDDVDWSWWPDELFSSWPALTSDEPLGVLPPSMMVSRPAMGQSQFVLQNLWQIPMNHHHLLPLWRWPFRRQAQRRWWAETSRWCRLKLMADELLSSWPALTSDEPFGVLPPSMMVSGPAMGRLHFVLQNLGQIRMNHRQLLPLWRRPFRQRARRWWWAETSRWCRLKLMAEWTFLLLASFNFWWTLVGLTTLDDGFRAGDRGSGLGARGPGQRPRPRPGDGAATIFCFKIFDKLAWIIIIFLLSEPDDDLTICQDLAVRQQKKKKIEADSDSKSSAVLVDGAAAHLHRLQRHLLNMWRRSELRYLVLILLLSICFIHILFPFPLLPVYFFTAPFFPSWGGHSLNSAFEWRSWASELNRFTVKKWP